MATSKDDDLKKKYGVDEEKMEETGALTERHLDLRSLTGEELDHLSLSTEVGVAEERVRAQASGDQVQAQGSAPAAKGAGELLADKKKQQQSTKRKRKPMSGLLVPLLFVVLLVFGVAWLLPRLPLSGVIPGGGSIPSVGADPTPTPVEAGEMELTVADLSVDTDGDVIPDKIETLIGYDGTKNDCIREIGCGEFPTLPKARLRLNLVFVLDASGSMSEEVNGVKKWDSAVEALTKVMATGFPGFTDVGLVVYGHRGSSSQEDQAVSCVGSEVVSELQPWRQTDVVSKTASLGPTGWTPLAGALQTAGEILATRQGEGNFIVILSDGKETCGGDPVAAAKELHEAGIEVTTNVVGVVVDEAEKEQLEAIASAGGGRYFPAENPRQLEQAVYLSSEVVRLWEQVNQCIVNNLTAYGQCINVQYLKAINFLKDERLRIEEENSRLNGGNGEKAPAGYVNLERKLWTTFEKLRDENWNQYEQDLGNLGL